MSRKRHRLNWTYDDARQEFRPPCGRVITLQEIACALYDHSETCRIDFKGPWTGWRMRGDRLIPPGTANALKPDTTRAFLRWINAAETEHLERSAYPSENRGRTKPVARRPTTYTNHRDGPHGQRCTQEHNEPADHKPPCPVYTRLHGNGSQGAEQRHQVIHPIGHRRLSSHGIPPLVHREHKGWQTTDASARRGCIMHADDRSKSGFSGKGWPGDRNGLTMHVPGGTCER